MPSHLPHRKYLSLEDIYHPQNKLSFSGGIFNGAYWIDGSHYAIKTEDPTDDPVVMVHARSQQKSPLYSWELLRDALAALPDVGHEEASQLARRPDLKLSQNRANALVSRNRDLFLYRFGDKHVSHLSSSQDPEVAPDFSPDGRFVSFIKQNNIHIFNVNTEQRRALTIDGSADVLCGRLTWVYQEELYGRNNFRGYWWSPNSRKVAFLTTDCSKVSSYSCFNDLETPQTLDQVTYPLPGTPNPKVSLHIIDIEEGGEIHAIDLSQYKSVDSLLVRVAWCPDSERVTYQIQDRQQTWLDLNLVDLNTGVTKKLLREVSPAWVRVIDNPWWLRDDSFLWQSERSGWRHIYHYQANGSLVKQITDGQWEIRDLYGIDEDNGYIFIKATTTDPTGNYTYRIDLEDGNLLLLTKDTGTHQSIFSKDYSLFLDYFSTSTKPPKVSLHESSGPEIRLVYENTVAVLDEYNLGQTDFLQVQARDGFALEAMLITPPEFDPSKRYPVLVYTYGGPGIPQVVNSWNGDIWMWHQMLAQKGYIVWVCDNRSASSKGAASAWPVHFELGVSELRDIEDGLDYLRSRPFVDANRIGLWGWSYGGFLTAYALTHSKSFKMGIAGAPVTDWTLYDSIYTERYLSTPENNTNGYHKSSVLKSAQNLDGHLLIIHGMMDDNVHVRNSVKLIHSLQQNCKAFDFMLYPGAGHKIDMPNQLYHLRTLMTDFVLEHL